MDAATVKASSTLGRVCGWEAPRTTCFVMYDDAVTCGGDSDCVWSYSARTCGNKVGYTSIESGLFAGSLIMGALVGSMSGGYLTKWLDYRKSFLLIGVISVTGAVLTHVATGVFQYWLLFVARIVAGFAVGWMPITAPHYTDRFSPKSLQKTLGTFFQVFVAFGTFVAAIFGICLGNTIAYDADHSANVMGRMQGFVSFTTLMSVLVMLLPLVTKDGHCLTSGYGWVDSEEGIPAATKAKAKKYPLSSMIKPALVGATMGCTMQLTGISANMNFAPTIMENLGLDALVGNVIVMAWYSAAAFFAIPLSKRFSMRTLFLSCTLVGSLCCVFLSGIPVYPGVTKVKLAKEVIAIIGIAMFIAAFDMGIASCFYVLSVDVFPESFRPIGSSITTGVMFAMNLVISICYPIATEGMSGGPSGDQDKGQAIAFIFFGCVGLVTFVIEYFYLFPWEDKDDFALGQLEDTQAEMQ
ncbi:putative glucose transporter/membrane transporter D2 [Leptomonas seymouri]|uniref:Putative glucose transporter/membrane transporter D2 n=1 Tax=Leptomonas seymouri TaxID=5684 RepID=A0A0N1P9H5_LEPSE|nr:putative glucose transporter/membrane transporter D2 [Leptomonas seymouri]|eukprot:KPI82593.1 putative glucose transporter/membrane transporter D2 [Leptomonas seymouri]